jgi:hypothetical protein
MTMLKFDTCSGATVGDEAHFDFSFQVWVILPVGADIPRQDQARRWVAVTVTGASFNSGLPLSLFSIN